MWGFYILALREHTQGVVNVEMKYAEMRQLAITRIKESIRCLRESRYAYDRGIEYGQASGVLYFSAEAGLLSPIEKDRFVRGMTLASAKARAKGVV